MGDAGRSAQLAAVIPSFRAATSIVPVAGAIGEGVHLDALDLGSRFESTRCVDFAGEWLRRQRRR